MSEEMSKENAYPLSRRPRRLRRTAAIRAMVEEVSLRPSDFIQPLFVIDGEGDSQPVDSMPNICRHPIEPLLGECEAALKAGVPAIALFPSIDASLKSDCAKEALNPDTLVLKAVRAVKERFPELCIISDIALDPYTVHGHDGILNASGEDVDNDATVDMLAHMSVIQAEAGVDFVAPSDMMDGRVGIIRGLLDDQGFTDTGIFAYSSKFASAYYGPFRDAVGSAQSKPISKSTYQLNPANAREAIMESLLDESEGADILMVKPAGAYLDIISSVRDQTLLPVAAYQVSGEYAQIHAAAERGWLDYERIRNESLLAIKRAGAGIILSYFATEVASII